MLIPATLAQLVAAFDPQGDGAAAKSRELIAMLLDHSAEPFSREQFAPGHITATGLVTDPSGSQVLLVHHRRLDRWLLPGGHVEPGDASVADAARREVVEETGADLDPGDPPLVNVDVHGIPPKGKEPYHQHHDLIFQFRARSTSLTLSEESHEVLWVPLDGLDPYHLPDNVIRSCRRLRR